MTRADKNCPVNCARSEGFSSYTLLLLWERGNFVCALVYESATTRVHSLVYSLKSFVLEV